MVPIETTSFGMDGKICDRQTYFFNSQAAQVAKVLEDVPDINAVAVCEYSSRHVQLLSLADGRHIRTIGTGPFSTCVYSIAYDAVAKVLVG